MRYLAWWQCSDHFLDLEHVPVGVVSSDAVSQSSNELVETAICLESELQIFLAPDLQDQVQSAVNVGPQAC